MTRLGDSPRQPLVMNAGSPHAQWIPIHRHGLVTLARMLKEAALEVFQAVFCEIPLTEKALEHSGFGTPFYGLSVMYFSIAHPVDTPFHPPITRLMKLHPEGSGICLCSLLRRCGSAWASSRNLIWTRCAESTKPKLSFRFKARIKWKNQ